MNRFVRELGGSTARQPAKLANRNIPYHRRRAQFVDGGWPGRVVGSGISAFQLFWEFKSSLVREFELCWEFHEKSANLVFCDHCLGTGRGSVVGW